MKKSITPLQLLIDLASKGDPSACISLFSDLLDTAYSDVRANGADHEDAVQKLSAFVVKLFRAVIQNPPGDDVEEWFALKRKRYLRLKDEIHAKANIIELERSDYAARISKVFQQEYSQLRSAQKNISRLMRLQLFIVDRVWLRIPLDLVLIAGVFLALQIYFLNADISLRFTMSLPKEDIMLSMPTGTTPFDFSSAYSRIPTMAHGSRLQIYRPILESKPSERTDSLLAKPVTSPPAYTIAVSAQSGTIPNAQAIVPPKVRPRRVVVDNIAKPEIIDSSSLSSPRPVDTDSISQ